MTLSAGTYAVPNGHVAAVVTYLEMAAPAAIAAKPFPDGITARQERLDVNSYRAIFRAVGAPWLWTSRLLLDDHALAAILCNPQTETWVVRKAGQAVALIELDFSKESMCELAFFGMIKNVTGQGLGGSMMALAQARAFHSDISLFTVHTCSLDDPRALRFYQKMGFTAVKRAVDIFADPRLDGVYDAAAATDIPCLT